MAAKKQAITDIEQEITIKRFWAVKPKCSQNPSLNSIQQHLEEILVLACLLTYWYLVTYLILTVQVTVFYTYLQKTYSTKWPTK